MTQNYLWEKHSHDWVGSYAYFIHERADNIQSLAGYGSWYAVCSQEFNHLMRFSFR